MDRHLLEDDREERQRGQQRDNLFFSSPPQVVPKLSPEMYDRIVQFLPADSLIESRGVSKLIRDIANYEINKRMKAALGEGYETTYPGTILPLYLLDKRPENWELWKVYQDRFTPEQLEVVKYLLAVKEGRPTGREDNDYPFEKQHLSLLEIEYYSEAYERPIFIITLRKFFPSLLTHQNQAKVAGQYIRDANQSRVYRPNTDEYGLFANTEGYDLGLFLSENSFGPLRLLPPSKLAINYPGLVSAMITAGFEDREMLGRMIPALSEYDRERVEMRLIMAGREDLVVRPEGGN